jgi:N-methylhydantoinase B
LNRNVIALKSGIDDPITFEVVKNALGAIADEMGIVLRRSSYSPNIKERKDFSCALFDRDGRLVTQAEHIPVHLGAMPHSVRTLLHEFSDDIREGDVFILNDPFHGGTHLPDITIAQPVFYNHELTAFAVNRAHHSDVGGSTPGSMSPLSTDVHQEGVLIPPTKLVDQGRLNKPFLAFLLSNVRTPKERLGDLRAQEAANTVGTRRMVELCQKYGIETFTLCLGRLLEYSRRLMLSEIRKLPRGSFSAVDYLDDDGYETRNIPINVKLTIANDGINFDFTGSSKQVHGAVNAVYSITMSAAYYVVRCVTNPSIPANEGCFRPVTVVAPIGTIVNAQPPAAVAGGNVETSQRIVDVTLKAFSQAVPERVCAGCQGTMNNLTIGGTDPRTGQYFAYYETIAGGFGARAKKDGINGIHSHMTNTMNTPIEALEVAYPFRITRYMLAEGTAGDGKFRGGMGVIRDIELLNDNSIVTLFGDRQTNKPWGLNNGSDGRPGKYTLIRRSARTTTLRSKCIVRTRSGDVVSIRTPGGGGYGKRRSSSMKHQNG